MSIDIKMIRKLIVLQVLLLPVMMFARSIFGLPHGVFVLWDIMLCLELVWSARALRHTLREVGFWEIIPYFMAFTAFLLLTQLLQSVSLGLSIMAFRRVYRFYLFYAVCMVLLTVADVENIMQVLVKLQIPNFILTMFQAFIQKVPQDNMGGIFGTTVGVNAYTNIYLCIICTYVLVMYFAKKETLKSVVLVGGSALLIAAVAELKLFFIEMPLIVVLAVILLRPTWKDLKGLAIGLIEYVIALCVFGKMYPEHLAVLLNKDSFLNYSTNVIAGYNISRLNAFSEINELFFKNDLMSNLFGFGFGNCETGSVFYEMYSEYHYTWFTHQVTFLETGYVGIVLYVLFYALVFFHAWRSRRKNPENKQYYVFTQITCVLCALFMLYNQSMRTEPAYLLFFALAIPLVVRKEWYRQES